jgi:hypothetical protein
MSSALLHHSRLSLITRDTDDQLRRIRNLISQPVLVDGRADVEQILSTLSHAPDQVTSRSLDLIGHSTPDRSLLMLGDWVIDGTSSKVLSFFRGLADEGVFARLGITSIRLLGCETAASATGRRTLIALSDTTELEIYGTSIMLDESAYDAGGFTAEHVLVSSTELRSEPITTLVKRGSEPFQRNLDIEMLPASPLGPRPAYPRHIADLTSARTILALIRRTEGAQMPGMFGVPTCELALPSTKSGWWHCIQMLLDGEFVRVFPDGDDRPGVVFPVSNASELRDQTALLPLG